MNGMPPSAPTEADGRGGSVSERQPTADEWLAAWAAATSRSAPPLARPARTARRPRLAPLAAALTVLVAVAVVMTGVLAPSPAAGPTPSPTSPGERSPSALTEFRTPGLSFLYPAEWRVYRAEAAFSMGFVLVAFATTPIPAACGTDRTDINCFYRQPLEPGTLAVVVGGGASLGRTIFDHKPPGGWTAFVDGMPAALTVGGPSTAYRSDESRDWVIARPGDVTNVLTVRAVLRGPGLDRMRAQVDALVASIRFDEKVAPLPSGPPAEVAADAVRRAIDSLDRDARDAYESDYYACFPRQVGEARDATIRAGPGGPLPGPLPVTCSVDVVPTELRLWQMDLVVEWAAGEGYAAGRYRERRWIDASGAPVGNMLLDPDVQFPATQPGLTPEPITSPLAIAPGSVVEVLEQGLTVYLTPDPQGDSLSGLNVGKRLYLVAGPVRVEEHDWYRVQWSPGRVYLPVFAWVQAEADGRAFIRPVTPACPASAPSVDKLVELIPAERLLCFGGREIELGPVFVVEHEPDFATAGSPAWLAAESAFRLYGAGGPEGTGGYIPGVVDPARGPELPVGWWLIVTGHFDDPAARGCSRAVVDQHAEGISPETPEEQELRCREQFVITEVRDR